ncbi:MAG: pallilysin-related adhesin [Treponema sp.]|nr:pallilysin-related adhesin [Treponema sp.]
MRKFLAAFFVLIAAALLVILLTKKTTEVSEKVLSEKQDQNLEQGAGNHSDAENALGMDDQSVVSFMPLKPDETLLSSMGIDLDGDNLDDEILVVKKVGNPFLYIIIGLYNPQTTLYDRISELKTEVTQFKSFSYNGMDVAGDHRTALVYQGFTDDGNAVLQMYYCSRRGLTKIGDFKSDGTIFIQQYNRTETYELSQSSGRSFPVWTYSSDTREGAGSLSQVQTEYDWNPDLQRYVQARQIFVAGKNVAAEALAKIQDGTVETFANYLNGLWYKTDNEDDEIRYIFLDYKNSEVIFLEGDSQEVYNWQNSNLYRNGIYLSTVNASIENLRRRFDISLTGLDEMRVHVYDDVRMRIGADALWNGNYKKMKSANEFPSNEIDTTDLEELRSRLEEIKQWSAPDGALLTFKNGLYTIQNESVRENGVYFVSQIQSSFVIQFNSQSSDRYIGNVYLIRYGTKTVEPTAKEKQRGKKPTVQIDKDVLILQPAEIMSNTAYEISGRVVSLSAENGAEQAF